MSQCARNKKTLTDGLTPVVLKSAGHEVISVEKEEEVKKPAKTIKRVPVENGVKKKEEEKVEEEKIGLESKEDSNDEKVSMEMEEDVSIDGLLAGPTIVGMDTEKTAVLDSLNQQISDFQMAETNNAQARADLQNQIDNANASMTQAMDVESKIQERIDAHNADLDNALPRLAKLEHCVEIDESGTEPVARIKGGVKFEASGDFVQGGGAIFEETPTMANDVAGQTMDTIDQQLNDDDAQNAENKLQLDFSKEVFTMDKENKTVAMNPEHELIIPNDSIQGWFV
eukprot:jgi/Bigna1/131132/aug1.13_g5840